MNAEVTSLVAKFPRPGRDRKLSDPDKEAMDHAVAELLKLRRTAVQQLVAALVDPNQGTDTQARHALHALATFVSAQDETTRRQFAQALASTLDGDRPKEAKGFVIRELQVCGGKEVTGALGNQLSDEALCADAAAALLAIGAPGDAFRKALPHGKSPKHRLTLIQSLGKIRDAAAADELRKAARDSDSEVRQSALWGLANLAQPADADLIFAAAKSDNYEGIQATKCCLLFAEKLLAAGHTEAASKAYQRLHDEHDSPEYIRHAAQRGLAKLRSSAGR